LTCKYVILDFNLIALRLTGIFLHYRTERREERKRSRRRKKDRGERKRGKGERRKKRKEG